MGRVGRIRVSGPRLLAAGIGLGLVLIGAAAPLRGSAFGEPTVLRPQRLAPIAVSAADTATPFLLGLQSPGGLDDGALGHAGPRIEPVSHSVDSVAAAEAELHRHVRTPQTLPDGLSGDPTTSVFSASSYAYTLDLPRIYETLKGAGIDDVQLPTSLHGATLNLNVPAGATLKWGSLRSGLVLTEVRLPSITVPAEVDITSLRDMILSDPRIVAANPDVVEQLRAIDDWQSAVPVPVGKGSRIVSVGDSDGLLMEDHRSGGRSLVWRRGGELNVLAGRYDPDVLIDVASSLR